jgi:hypothetical protein
VPHEAGKARQSHLVCLQRVFADARLDSSSIDTNATNYGRRLQPLPGCLAILLAHAATSVTDSYDMTDVEDLREPLEAVTTRILGLCEGKVTPLERKAA